VEVPAVDGGHWTGGAQMKRRVHADAIGCR